MALALTAALSSTADAALRHRYSFTNDANDSVGVAHGTVVDAGAATAVFAGGKLNLSANVGNGSSGITEDAYVDLPNGIISAAANGGVAGQLTVEIWAQAETNRNWAALFSAGTSNGGENSSSGGNAADYIQVIPQNGQNQRIRTTTHRGNVNAEGQVDFSAAMSTTQTTHIVSVYDQSGGLPGTVTMYVDGALIGSSPIAGDAAPNGFLNLGAMTDNNNWLGRSQWPDSVFDGWYDEVRIYDSALLPGQVAASFTAGAEAVVPEPASLVLGVAGLGLIAAIRRRKESN
jgi:MYXO-CTERM domain-containing protein